jgi:hypothetical protein
MSSSLQQLRSSKRRVEEFACLRNVQTSSERTLLFLVRSLAETCGSWVLEISPDYLEACLQPISQNRHRASFDGVILFLALNNGIA